METGEDVRVLLTLGLNCVVMEQIITVMDRLMKIVVNRTAAIGFVAMTDAMAVVGHVMLTVSVLMGSVYPATLVIAYLVVKFFYLDSLDAPMMVVSNSSIKKMAIWLCMRH